MQKVYMSAVFLVLGTATQAGQITVRPPDASTPAPIVTTSERQPDAQIAGHTVPSIPDQLKGLPADVKIIEVRGRTAAAPPFWFGGDKASDVDTLITNITPKSDVIAVVRITKRDSRFNERQTWIVTTVTAQILTLLEGEGLAEGGTLTFQEDGGELAYDGRQLYTSDAFAEPTQLAHDYLVFLYDPGKYGASSRYLTPIDSATVFEVKDNQIHKRLRPDLPVQGGRDLEAVKERVRAAKRGGAR